MTTYSLGQHAKPLSDRMPFSALQTTLLFSCCAKA
jgi:hypothetical protein